MLAKVALLALIVSVAYSGHISYVDSNVANINTGYVKNVTLNFMLESALPSGLYVNADFGAVPGSSPVCYIYALGAADTGKKISSCAIASTNGVTAKTESALAANTWYSLRITLTGNNWNANALIGPIKLSTSSMSLGTANNIIYDINNAGPLLAVGAAPSGSILTLTYTASTEATKSDPGATSTSSIKIKTTADYANGGVYVLTLSDAKFAWASDPAFLADTCAADATNCLKSVKPDGFKVTKISDTKAEILATKIVKDNTFFLTLKIKNTVGTASAIDMVVELLSPNKNMVIAKSTQAGVASVSAPAVSNEATTYHWGIPTRAGSGMDRAPIGMYYSADSAANVGVVNSVTLGFKVAKALPATQHKVEVKLSNKVTPLQGSYTTDLPAATGKSISIQYTSNKLVISNVGTIAADTKYSLSLRCAMVTSSNAATAKTEIADFGKTTIKVDMVGDTSVAASESAGAAAPAAKHNKYEKVTTLPTQVFNVATTASSADADFDALKGELAKIISANAATGYAGLRTTPGSSNKGLLILIGKLANLAANGITASKVQTSKGGDGPANGDTEQAVALALVAPKELIASANYGKGVGAFQKLYGATDKECFDATNVLDTSTVKGKTCTGYNTNVANAQQNRWVNPANTNYLHLEFVCRNAGTIGSSLKFKSICTSTISSELTTTGAGTVKKTQGIVLPEVVLASVSAPTQYVNSQVLEFPMAVIQAANAGTTWSTAPAEDLTRLIQTFVITAKSTQANVRATLVNTALATGSDAYDNLGKRVPVLARLGGQGAVAGTAFTNFFTQVDLKYIDSYTAWSLNNYPCVMIGAADATCDMGLGMIGTAIPDGFWQFGSWVRVNKALKTDAVVTAYAPVGYKNSLNNNMGKAASVFTMANGASNANSGVYIDYSGLRFGASSVTKAVLGTYTTAPPTKYTESSGTDWILKTAVTAANSGIIAGNTWAKPGAAPSTAVFKALKVTLSGAVATPSATAGYGAAVTFVAVKLNIWNGATAKYKTAANSCAALTYTGSSSSTDSKYCMICFSDSEEIDGDVNVTGLKVPTIWGGSAVLSSYLETAYSGAPGLLAYIKANVANNAANKNTGCTLGALTGVKHVTSSYGSFKVTLGIKTTLPSAADTLVFKITVTGDRDVEDLSSAVTDVTGLTVASSTRSSAVTTVTMTPTAGLEVKAVTVSGVFTKSSTAPNNGKYTAEVFIGGTTNQIDNCATAVNWKGTTVSDANALVGGSASASNFMVKTKNIDQTFEATFSTSSFTTWKGAQYTINFGSYLSGSGQNFRCVALDSSNAVSSAFSTIDSSSLSAVKVTITAPMSSGSLRCYGVKTTATGTNKFAVTYGTSSTAVGTKTDSANPAFGGFSTGAATALNVAVTKTQTLVGMNAEYKLVVKVAADQAAGASCLRVAFSSKVAPKLNAFGAVRCLQGDKTPVPVNCQFAAKSEGVLTINPNGPLKKDSTDGYTFHIAGVTVATGVTTSEKVAVSLINSANMQALEHAEKPESAAPTATNTPLVVSSISAGASAPLIRGTSSYTYTLTLPAATVSAAGAEASVFLPMNLNTNANTGVSVSIYRSDDTSKANIVEKTTKTNFNRVDLTLKADAANSAAKDYVVTVSGVPTPSTPGPLSYPTVAFKKGTNYFSTLPGTNNADSVSAVAGKYQLLNWANDLATANVGYWSSQSATLNAGGNGFKGSSALTVSGDTAKVKVAPASPGITVGKKETKLLLAAAAGTDAGLYSLSFAKTDDTSDATFSPINNLNVLVKTDKCTLTVPAPITVAAGSSALPSIMKLTSCFPETDVTIKASLTAPPASRILTEATDAYKGKITVTPADGARAIKYVAGTTSYSAYWTVGCSDKTLAAKSDAGKLYWSLDGTNKDSFALSGSTTSINVAAAATAGDVTAKISSVTPAAGQVSFAVQCSKASLVYWTFDQDKSGASVPTLDNIKAATLDAGLEQTALPAKGLMIMGYNIAATAATDVSISVSKVLAAKTDYVLNVYCAAPEGNSQAVSKKWTQTDNGGKPVLITYKASAAITDEENDKLTCGTAKALALTADRVFSILGKTCSSLTASGSGSGSSRLLQGATTYNEQTFVSVAPNRFASADNSHTTITAAVGGADFTKDVKAAGGSGLTLSPTASATSTLASAAPKVTLTLIDNEVTETSANVEVAVDPSGNYYVAVLEASATAPTKESLVSKQGSDGSALDKYQSGYAADKTAKKLSFNGLNKKTKYKIYATASTVAPPSSVVTATVTNKEFETKNAYALSMALFAIIALFGFAIMM